MTTCKLCQKRRPLKKSHIFGRAGFERMRRAGGNDQVVFVEKLMRTVRETQRVGWREELLCENCERKFANWENYYWNVVDGKTDVEKSAMRIARGHPGSWINLLFGTVSADVYIYRKLDYAQWKLHGLSLLWRAGVAKSQAFRQTTLGRHEESLRLILNYDRFLPEDAYPCLQYMIWGGSVGLSHDLGIQIVVPPAPRPWGAHDAYEFVYGGFGWIFALSQKPIDPDVQNLSETVAINRNGEMKALVVDMTKLPWLTETIADTRHYKKKGNLQK